MPRSASYGHRPDPPGRGQVAASAALDELSMLGIGFEYRGEELARGFGVGETWWYRLVSTGGTGRPAR